MVGRVSVSCVDGETIIYRNVVMVDLNDDNTILVVVDSEASHYFPLRNIKKWVVVDNDGD